MSKTILGSDSPIVEPEEIDPQGDGSGLDADTVDTYEGHAPTKSAHDALGIDADTVDGSHASELAGAMTEQASVYLSVNQTISTATVTKAQLDTEDFDVGNNFDSSTNYEYVVPSDGYYFVASNGLWNNNNTDQSRLDGMVQINGTDAAKTSAQSSGTGYESVAVPGAVLSLTAGDSITLAVKQETGGSLDLWGGNTPHTYLTVGKIA